MNIVENRDFPLKFAQLTTFYLLILKQKFKWLLIDRKQLLPHFLYFENTRGNRVREREGCLLAQVAFPSYILREKDLKLQGGGRRKLA